MKTETGYISVDDGSIFYELSGDGDCIVLLHDGIVHREVWDGQFSDLAKRYKVVRYDRRGYGKSDYPRASFSNIEDLCHVFDHLKIESAIIFGISGGGELAIDFTLKYPGKVNGLVLSGAIVSGFGVTSHALTRGGNVLSTEELIADPQKLMEYFVWSDPYETNPENRDVKEKLYALLKSNPYNLKYTLTREQLKEPPERPALRYLSEIKVPVLILVGEYDMPDVHAHAGAIEVGIPNAKREIIFNSGHLIPFEQPEAFNKSVLSFLNSV